MKKKWWKKVLAVLLFLAVFSKDTVLAVTAGQKRWKDKTSETAIETVTENKTENTSENTIEEPQNLYALSACLMDAESGRILFGKEEKVRRANASTTKIMTLILTLENADLNEIVTFSDYAASQPDVQLNAASGEQFLLKDLCYSLMLESHNDTAVAIAEHVAGSVEAFAVKMNEKADEIGCEDTYFITPNGLDREDEKGIHGTTASDLARIMSYCINRSPMKDTFLEITKTLDYSFTNIEGNRSYSCTNHNRLLTMMDGALSGKTGFTGNAGYCYVGALKRDDRIFVVALLGCGWPDHKNYKWSDTGKLMQYGMDSYEKVNLLELDIPKEAVYPVEIEHARTGDFSRRIKEAVYLQAAEDQTDTLLLRKDEKIEFRLEQKKLLTAPVQAGTSVGTLQYILDGRVVREADIKIKDTIPAWDYRYSLRKMVAHFQL